MAILGAMAMAGNKASPSLLMAFPNSAENGTNPLRYIVVITICGPQPGINPTSIAIRGTNGAQTSNSSLRSISVK